MQVQGSVMPGYRIYEYMLILNPHEELRNRITTVREEFNTRYKIEKGVGFKSNLGIASFMEYEMKEESILKKLRAVALGFAPFKVELKDFGSFPSHTVYINVTSRVPVQHLVTAVKTAIQAWTKLNKETKPHFFQDPHITVAMKLKPWQYEKAWLEYSQTHFTGRFIADSMLILKRQEGTKSWQIVERLDFQNMYVPATKQGDLFS
ncbi:MAG: 2'-5' RNA ligase family protein [Bacteroidota bacterium]